jgi:hypothetical protein
MRADFVLLDSNPLENIDYTRKIRTVVAAGRVFERKELDMMRSDIQRERVNGLELLLAKFIER